MHFIPHYTLAFLMATLAISSPNSYAGHEADVDEVEGEIIINEGATHQKPQYRERVIKNIDPVKRTLDFEKKRKDGLRVIHELKTAYRKAAHSLEEDLAVLSRHNPPGPLVKLIRRTDRYTASPLEEQWLAKDMEAMTTLWEETDAKGDNALQVYLNMAKGALETLREAHEVFHGTISAFIREFGGRIEFQDEDTIVHTPQPSPHLPASNPLSKKLQLKILPPPPPPQPMLLVGRKKPKLPLNPPPPFEPPPPYPGGSTTSEAPAQATPLQAPSRGSRAHSRSSSGLPDLPELRSGGHFKGSAPIMPQPDGQKVGSQ